MESTTANIRPTRHRLQFALGLAACVVCGLLASAGRMLDFVSDPSSMRAEQRTLLAVRIRNPAPLPSPEPESARNIVRSAPGKRPLPAEPGNHQHEVAIEPATESAPAIDWHTLTAAIVTTNVDEFFRSEQTRVAMRQQTHSLMFQHDDDFATRPDEPLLADVRFKPRVHVFGLGLTIGSCFIGIPLAGVPVEQRTVAITLFVCASEPG